MKKHCLDLYRSQWWKSERLWAEAIRLRSLIFLTFLLCVGCEPEDHLFPIEPLQSAETSRTLRSRPESGFFTDRQGGNKDIASAALSESFISDELNC